MRTRTPNTGTIRARSSGVAGRKSWREINRFSSGCFVEVVKHGLDGEINFTNPSRKNARLETLRVHPVGERFVGLEAGLRVRCPSIERVLVGLTADVCRGDKL